MRYYGLYCVLFSLKIFAEKWKNKNILSFGILNVGKVQESSYGRCTCVYYRKNKAGPDYEKSMLCNQLGINLLFASFRIFSKISDSTWRKCIILFESRVTPFNFFIIKSHESDEKESCFRVAEMKYRMIYVCFCVCVFDKVCAVELHGLEMITQRICLEIYEIYIKFVKKRNRGNFTHK